jgi:hypothetical protein
MNTGNIDSLGKSVCNIIQTIPVDSNRSRIMFYKTTVYAFTIKEEVIDYIRITNTDDIGESIDWNIQHWNMTLYFTVYEDIERFKTIKTFNNILTTGYVQI